jgi:SAM-dependent methyltransferase
MTSVDDFPFQRKFLPSPEQMFSALRQCDDVLHRIERQHTHGKYGRCMVQSTNGEILSLEVLPRKLSDYRSFECIADHFTEDVRVSGRLKQSDVSPLQRWKTDEEFRARVYGDGSFDLPTIRDRVWKDGSMECNHFIASRVIGITNLLLYMSGAISNYNLPPSQIDTKFKVYDSSSGWGDRAMAIASYPGSTYRGVDPNPELITGYRAMVDFVNNLPYEHGTIEFIQGGAEEYIDDRYGADFAITSPPFFDHELYNTSDPNQSIAKYPNKKDWINVFFRKLVENNYRMLKPGGFFAIHVVDTYYIHGVVDALMKFAANVGFVYRGYLCLHQKKMTPMFIFYKPS